MFEIFLQSYHFKTGNGLDKKFDSIRRFARYNEGDAKLYYVLNRGIYLMGDYMKHPIFPMTDSCINEIEQEGFYTLYLNGHMFVLEVVPHDDSARREYLQKLCDKHEIGGGIYPEMQEVMYINQIDFTLSSLYHTRNYLK